MVRFPVVESTHTGSYPKFGMSVTYLWLIILLVVGDVPGDNEVLFVTDFINLKINLTQSFKDVYVGRVCMHVFIEGVLIRV
jgi:hypothetical protein